MTRDALAVQLRDIYRYVPDLPFSQACRGRRGSFWPIFQNGPDTAANHFAMIRDENAQVAAAR